MFEVETPGEKSSGVFCCQELFLASSDRLALCQTLFRIPYDIAKQCCSGTWITSEKKIE